MFTLIFDQQLSTVIMGTRCSLHYVTKYVISYDISADECCKMAESGSRSKLKVEWK